MTVCQPIGLVLVKRLTGRSPLFSETKFFRFWTLDRAKANLTWISVPVWSLRLISLLGLTMSEAPARCIFISCKQFCDSKRNLILVSSCLFVGQLLWNFECRYTHIHALKFVCLSTCWLWKAISIQQDQLDTWDSSLRQKRQSAIDLCFIHIYAVQWGTCKPKMDCIKTDKNALNAFEVCLSIS